MHTWNSTLKPSRKPLARSAWKPRSREKRGPGLAQRVAFAVGTNIKHERISDDKRNEQHRRNVAALPCAVCRIEGFSQAAHVNASVAGKGLGMKAPDVLTFPLCCDRPGVRGCHSLHDQGGIYTKQERLLREWEYVDQTRAQLIRRNQWPTEVEAAYQIAIQPLARVVHGEVA